MIRACPDDPGQGPDDPGRSTAHGMARDELKKWGEIRRFRGFWMDFEVEMVGEG